MRGSDTPYAELGPMRWVTTHAHSGTDTGVITIPIPTLGPQATVMGIDIGFAAVSVGQSAAAVANWNSGVPLWADGSETTPDLGKYLSWRGSVPMISQLFI